MTGGSTNQTLIRQFRLPGYPFVLIATDVLQEGEDLHTFCSRVYHYGISWTPSAMEQRTGRIDRVRSQTDRRLSRLGRALEHDDRLQVYFPHLGDTVEALQVRRVLRRMDRFLRLMHEGLAVAEGDERSVHVDRAMLDDVRYPEPIRERLHSAFEIPEWAVNGRRQDLGRTEAEAENVRERFERLASEKLGSLGVAWERHDAPGPLMGTAHVGARIQPFTLYLKAVSHHVAIRCISPVGQVGIADHALLDAVDHAGRLDAPVAAVIGPEDGAYDLSVEDDVLLGAEEHDSARVEALVRRVVEAADELERAFLGDQDAPLQDFEHDLRREGTFDA